MPRSPHFTHTKMSSHLSLTFPHHIASPTPSRTISQIRIVIPPHTHDYVSSNATSITYQYDDSDSAWITKQMTSVNLRIRDLHTYRHKFKILVQFYSQNGTNTPYLLKTYSISLNELFASERITFVIRGEENIVVRHWIGEVREVDVHLRHLQRVVQQRNTHVDSAPWKGFMRYYVRYSSALSPAQLRQFTHDELVRQFGVDAAKALESRPQYFTENPIIHETPLLTLPSHAHLIFCDEFEPIRLTTTTQHLMTHSLYVEVVRVLDNKYITEGVAEIPLHDARIFEETIPVQCEVLPNNPAGESLLRGAPVIGAPPPHCIIVGMLSVQNVSRFVQSADGVLRISCTNDERSITPETKPRIQSELILPERLLTSARTSPQQSNSQSDLASSTSSDDLSSASSTFETRRKEKRRDLSKKAPAVAPELAPKLTVLDMNSIALPAPLVAEYMSSHEGLPSVPLQCDRPFSELRGSYFEVTVLRTGFGATADKTLRIGAAPQNTGGSYWLGSTPSSYALDASGTSHHANKRSAFSATFDAGDVIGCGIDERGIYFTRNGKMLGFAFYPVGNEDTLYPSLQFFSKYTKVRFNFGQERFVFNVMKATLPANWRLGRDVDGRMNYKNTSTGEALFHDPRDETPEWCKYHEMHENMVRNLSTPKRGSWRGITSRWLLHALRSVPRAAFVEETNAHMAGSGLAVGLYTSAQVVARALDALQLRPGLKFLNLGCRGGWATALGGLLVESEGKSIGIDSDMSAINDAKRNLRKFTRYSGVDLDSAQFYARTVFGLGKAFLTEVPVSIGRDFDAIFCERALTEQQITELGEIVRGKGAKLACFVGEELTLFKWDGHSWDSGVSLMKVTTKLHPISNPTSQQVRTEKRLRLVEYFTNANYPCNLVERAIDLIGEEDRATMAHFLELCALGAQGSGGEDLLQTLQMLGRNVSLAYFSNLYFLQTTHKNASKRRIRELFALYGPNVGYISQVLGSEESQNSE